MTDVLVTGGAGKTGRAVIAALARRGVAVRALVHRDEQANAVEGAGAVDVVVGDQRDVDVVATACRSVRAVYGIAPNLSPDEVTMARALVDGCRRAGVGRIVYHSVIHPQLTAMPHHADKARAEEALFEAALPITVLQPNAYFENVTGYLDRIMADGVYEVPYHPVRPLWMVALSDVAEVAATVLTEPGHEHATYELSGPRGLAAADVARTFGEQLDRPVVARPVDPATAADRAGLTGDRRVRLVAMFRNYDRLGSPGNPNVLRLLLRREPTDFTEWVAEQLARRGVTA